jgi:hypothetical protein
MNPATPVLSSKYFDWLTIFHDGLKRVVDSNEDGAISGVEFVEYVRKNKRVNQKWLIESVIERPCIVANALVHYQFVMKMSRVARGLRDICAGSWWTFAFPADPAKSQACAERNFVIWKDVFGDGPAYYEEENGPQNSPDAAKCSEAIASTTPLGR